MLHFYLSIVVQVLVESLPISSSGHLILLQRFLQKFSAYIPSDDSVTISLINNEAFVHFLHGPTIIILLIFFAHRMRWCMQHRARYWYLIMRIALLVVLADGMTIAWYFLFKSSGVEWFPITVGFLITAALLLSLRWCADEKKKGLTFQSALIIGAVQGVALLPGISRLASTYVAARWLSVPPRKAIEFSLLIELPLITAAFCKSVYVLRQTGLLAQLLNLPVLLIMLSAGIGSAMLLYIVIRMACKKQWWLFAWYVALLVVVMNVIK